MFQARNHQSDALSVGPAGCCPQNGCIIGFGAAAGEEHLFRLGAHNLGHRFPGLLQGIPGRLPFGVGAGGIPAEPLIGLGKHRGDELLHYTTLSGAVLAMPRLSVEPGGMDGRGAGLFRGRFGTTPTAQNAGAPVILHPFRYWDRWADRADAPELAYFGFGVDQPNAFWRSAFFEAEEPSSGAAHIEVLQRVTQYLGQPPVPWDADPADFADLMLLDTGSREGHAIGT